MQQFHLAASLALDPGRLSIDIYSDYHYKYLWLVCMGQIIAVHGEYFYSPVTKILPESNYSIANK